MRVNKHTMIPTHRPQIAQKNNSVRIPTPYEWLMNINKIEIKKNLTGTIRPIVSTNNRTTQ